MERSLSDTVRARDRIRWKGSIAVAFAAALFSGKRALAEVEVWRGGASWSVDSAWLDGSAPPIGGDPALTLEFGSFASSATNDLPGVFTLNRLVFNEITSVPSLAGAAGSSLLFSGLNPGLVLNGMFPTSLTIPLAVDAASGPLTFSGSGIGNLSVSNVITSTAGIPSLVIATNPGSPNLQTISFSSPSAFSSLPKLSADVLLQSGNVIFAGPVTSSAGTLTVTGGTVRFTDTFAQPIVLHSDLVVNGALGTISGAISSAVPGTGVILRSNQGTLALTGASTYTGPTSLDNGFLAEQAVLPGGVLSLSGNGALRGTSAIHVGAQSTLRLFGSVSGIIDRLPDSAPVTLRNSSLVLSGSDGGTRETIGPLKIAGYSNLTLGLTPGGYVELSAASLSRPERGTLLVRGASLGSSAAASVTGLRFANAPALIGGGAASGVNTSILPYAIGDHSITGEGTSFVTYSAAGGLRLLNTATDFATSLGAGSPTTNYRLTSSGGVPQNMTINSLILEGVPVSGTGILSIASGAVIQRGTGAAINSRLNFGSVEGQIFAVGELNSSVTIAGAISGSGGLTKSGNANLILSGANTFTGPLTINSARVLFSTLANLGAGTSPIVLQGHLTALSYTGSSAVTLTRNLETHTGIGGLESTGAGALTFTGSISGPGGMRFGGSGLTLAGTNTYTGATRLSSANIRFSNQAAFGPGPMEIKLSTLTPTDSWTTPSEIALTDATTLVLNGVDAAWNGPLLGTGALTLSGSGTLSLGQSGTYSGAIALGSAGLELHGAGSIRSTSISMGPGSRLTLDNSAMPHNARVLDSAGVVMNGAALIVKASPAADVTETLRVIRTGAESSITLSNEGPRQLTLRLITDNLSAAGLLLRGDGLGGPASGPFTRLVSTNFASFGTGLIPTIVAGADAAGPATSFALYDSTVDAAGPVGLRALRPEEYTFGATIQNAANGGATPDTAHFLGSTNSGAVGPANTVRSITLPDGGALTLDAGQTLAVTSGAIFVGGSATISGGTIDVGSAGTLHNRTAMLWNGGITGLGGMSKSGPGTLTFRGLATFPLAMTVNGGALEIGSDDPLRGQVINLVGNGTLRVIDTGTTIGGLSGNGMVEVGNEALTIGSAAVNTSFSGRLTGSGSITIVDGGNPFATRGITGTSSFTGSVILQSGTLESVFTSLGTGPLVGNGGSFRATGNISGSPTLQLNADLPLVGTSRITLASGTTVSGPGALVVQSTAGLGITGALSIPGGLVAKAGPENAFVSPPGAIEISGVAGSLTSPVPVRIESGGRLFLNDATVSTAGRLADGMGVDLGAGTLALMTGTTANQLETMGVLRGSGLSTVQLTPNTTRGTQLTVSALERIDRGTFALRSDSALGTAGVAANVGQFRVTNVPALIGGAGIGPAVSILPWAVGSSFTATGLVTFDANGARILTAAEYHPTLATALPGQNVRLIATQTNEQSRALNALVLNGTSVLGSGTLTIGSGAILQPLATPQSTIANAIDFGAVEGQFLFSPSTPGSLLVSGEIHGSGGITKSGGTLYLNGANTFTGPVTINGGALYFQTPANLGAGTEPIALHGNDAILAIDGARSVTLNRPVDVRDGVGSLATTDVSAVLEMAGGVTGSGRVRVMGPGRVILNPGNTFTGALVAEGNVTFRGDSALGASNALALRSGTGIFQLGASWESTRTIFVETSSTIDTNGFDAVLHGPIAGSSTLTKTGAGVLQLRGISPSDSPVVINAGALELSGNGTLNTSSYTVASGGMLRIDNAVTNLPNRISDNASITLNGGELEFVGGTEKLGNLTNAAATTGRVTVNGAPSHLTFENFSAAGSVIFAGAGLGETARVRFAQTPGLAGNLLLAALVQNAGGNLSFAEYVPTADADGVIGIRAIDSTGYSTDSEIRNPANGGTTAVAANVLGTTALIAGGTANTINSLTLNGTSTLTLTPGQNLKIGAAGVLAQTLVEAAIVGGRLSFGAMPARFHNASHLRLASDLDAASLVKTGNGRLDFEPPSYFNGTVSIAEGTLRAGTGDALRGSTTTVAAGAELNLTAGPATLRTLSGGGSVVLGTAGLSVGTAPAFTGTISGPGGLTVRESFTVTTPQTYTGATTLLGALTLTGEGSLPGTSQLVARRGGLNIYSESLVSSGLDGIPIHLNHGYLFFSGNSTAPGSQSFGSLTGSGFSTISAFASPTMQPVTLNFGTLNREDRGTFDFRNSIAGVSYLLADGRAKFTFDPALANQLVGSGSSATQTPILPFAISSDGGALVTFNPVNGVRALADSELSPTLTSGSNVRLVATTVNDNDVTVNALVLRAGLSGTGTLSITSGLLYNNGVVSLNKNVSFGAREGIVFSSSTFGGAILTLGGVLSGSEGITFSGPDNFVITGVNTFTGPLTINQGTVRFNTLANLGPETSPIILNDGGLFLNGSTALNFTRPIRLTGTSGKLSSASSFAPLLVMSAPLSGPGGVTIEGAVEFASANTYSGDTTVTGSLRFHSDAALGIGGQVRLGGTLLLAGPWTSDRNVVLTSAAIIDTAGFDASLHGPLTRSALDPVNFTKKGAGTLSLGDIRGFSGTFIAAAGTLRFRGEDWSLPNRISDPVALTFNSGTVAIQAHPTIPTDVRLGALTLSATPGNRLSLEAQGAAPIIVRANLNTDVAGALLAISGTDFAGGPAGVFSRLQIDTPLLVEGALPGFVILSPGGEPQGYATYDFTQDAAGAIGVRALRPSEYLNTSLISNPTNGGTTPTRGNIRLSGPATAQGVSNVIETLTFASSGALRMQEGQNLVLGRGSLLVEPGTTASLEGGTLQFGSSTAEFFVGGDLTIASKNLAPFVKYGPGTLTWSTPESYARTMLVDQGTLRIGTPNALEFATVTLNEKGTLRVPNLHASVSSLTGSGSVQLDPGSTLTLTSSTTFAGAFHGSGTLRIGLNNTFIPTGISDFTGRLFMEGTSRFQPGGTLLLSDSGRFTAVSEIVARNGGTLRWQTAASSLPAHVPITLEGGILDLQTGTAALSTGPLTASGLGIVSVATSLADSVQFDFDDLAVSPTNGGQFQFKFSNSNAGAAPGPGIANLRFGPTLASRLVGSGSTPVNHPVIPFAIGTYPDPSTGTVIGGLLTHSPVNGLRLLSAGEYSSTMSPGVNVRLSTFTEQNTDITVNSLTLAGSSLSLSGSGVVHVESGAVLAGQPFSIFTISANLDFGNRRGNIFTVANSLTLSGKISGTAGLAISGPTTLANTTNDFTGPIILNATTVSFNDPAVFGPSTNPILLNNGELYFSSTSLTTFNHPIELGASGGSVGRISNATLTLAGSISGPGALRLEVPNTVLSGANFYTGSTYVEQNVTLASAQGFGFSPQIDLRGTIRLLTPWTTAAGLNIVDFSATIDTNGFNATITGPVTGNESYNALNKRGLGRLTINDARGLTSPVNLAVGTLKINGPLGGNLTSEAGTTLTGNADIAGVTLIKGRIEPGDSVGEIQTRNISLLNGASLGLQLASSLEYDRLKASGSVSLGQNVQLELSLMPGFSVLSGADRLIILDNDGTDPIAQDAAGGFFNYNGNVLTEAEMFGVNGFNFRISYTGGTGNDVELFVVPEPGITACLWTAILTLVGWRRRERVF